MASSSSSEKRKRKHSTTNDDRQKTVKLFDNGYKTSVRPPSSGWLERCFTSGRLDSTLRVNVGCKTTTLRVGLRMNKVVIRLSTEHDLLEERAHPPSQISNMDNPNFIRDETGGAGVTPNTIFLSPDRAVLLLKMMDNLNGRYMHHAIPENKRVVKMICSEAEEDQYLRDLDRYLYYPHCFPRLELHSDRLLTITTYVARTGQNQLDMTAVETGSVTLTHDEWIRLADCQEYYSERIRDIEQCHDNIANLIMTKAGECISRMVRTKIGPIHRSSDASDENELFKAFHEAYSEFTSFSYCKTLHKEISDEVLKRKLNTHNINIKHLIHNVLSQIDILSSSQYLK